jgi:hypothetical protein
MADRLVSLLEDLARAESLSGRDLARANRRSVWLTECTGEQLGEFLEAVASRAPLGQRADSLLKTWLSAVVTARRTGGVGIPVAVVERLYGKLGPASNTRGVLLAWLAAPGGSEELATIGRLLVDDPPRDESAIVQGMAPLFQQRRSEVASLFPNLLAALVHPGLAAPVLDLANFLTREKLVDRHPAAEHGSQLVSLLGELVQSLSLLEERPQDAADSPQQLSERVSRAVALMVSLCDALGLIGDEKAIPKLHQALSIGHRRVKTEAAAALARLGDKRGADELLQLAAEPVARLRVLAYAEELGLSDKLDPQFATPQARAEAELCVWLAEPTQFGVPPAQFELFDQRQQFWPGFAQPVNCYLFRFQYVVTVEGQGERSFSNIGIAGPLAHAFLADLGDLSPDDIYAAFAGWQAQHEEIREYDVARLSQSEQLEVERLRRRLNDAGYAKIEPQTMGYFFSEKALIAHCTRDGVEGVAVADFQDIFFFPRRGGPRSLGPSDVYCIYKGRKLLKTFNE